MSDENGQFPLGSLNSWEREVVHAELARPNVSRLVPQPVARRPSTRSASPTATTIGNWRSMHPDFVFFHEVGGKIVGRRSSTRTATTSTTSLVKLQGARRASPASTATTFHRIEALSMVQGRMKVLDMQLSRSVTSCSPCRPAVDMYVSNLAIEYDAHHN